MYLLKKFSLALIGIAFFLSLSVISSYAQPGRARWSGNNGQHRGWYQGQRNGWDNGRKRGWQDRNVFWQGQNNRGWQTRNYRYGRINPWEYRRLQRQRYNIYRSRNRYYNDDGYLDRSERRKLTRKYYRYRRNVDRDRRDW